MDTGVSRMHLNFQAVAKFGAPLAAKLLLNQWVKRTRGVTKSWLFPLGLRRFELFVFIPALGERDGRFLRLRAANIPG